MMIAALMVITSMAFTAIYSQHIASESEKRDCDALAADIHVYQETPPVSKTGLNQWRSKVERYTEIGCKPQFKSPVVSNTKGSGND